MNNMPMPTNMDVDWAFLDQWMALPNPDIVPLNEGSLPFHTSTPLPQALPANHNVSQPQNHSREARTGGAGLGGTSPAPTDTQAPPTEWTDTPYRFLSGNDSPNKSGILGQDVDAGMLDQANPTGRGQSPGPGPGAHGGVGVNIDNERERHRETDRDKERDKWTRTIHGHADTQHVGY